ncbi:MAG: FKBP-type peptidyl-prolyl cis-trans isomerase [Gammaproteobacteria bacterium]|nr:FKBP-type peptidyl-prolyl cis-trans isomerase [Gammaproteobacteria bacterium]
MKYNYLVITLASALALGACNKKADVDLSDDKNKLSYAIGFQVGSNLKAQEMDVNPDAIAEAIADVLADTKSKLTHEQMQAAMMNLQKKKMEAQQAKGDENKKAGEAFLAENKKKEGVKVTESGLQYKVVEAGKGNNPKESDTVVVHYRGTLIDGTEFDSSYSRKQPATFKLGQVIKGWQEALKLMKPGGKMHVAIPSDLAYGERGAGGKIGPNSTLLFEINLIEVKK